MLEKFDSFGYGPYNSLSTGAGTFSVCRAASLEIRT